MADTPYVPRHKAKFAAALAEPKKRSGTGKKGGKGKGGKGNAWRAYVGGK
jgi:hypothetical protein